MTESGPRGDRTARNAQALAAAIAELGLRCAIEARGGLVLLMPDPESVAMLANDETRKAALALARQHGFTHAAIELPNDRRRDDSEPDATVPRD
jgi:sugar phosphate isomerase/epimerase